MKKSPLKRAGNKLKECFKKSREHVETAAKLGNYTSLATK